MAASSPGSHTELNNELLLFSLSQFFTEGVMNSALPVLQGTSKISLRMIDFFVTSYSKRHTLVIQQPGPTPGSVRLFNVHDNYEDQLKVYSKQQFDPFRRRERVKFYYALDKFIETTIGQLNFFRWILQNKLLEYIAENIDGIEAEMLPSRRGKASKLESVPPIPTPNNNATTHNTHNTLSTHSTHNTLGTHSQISQISQNCQAMVATSSNFIHQVQPGTHVSIMFD